ncbi:MAG: hypothetical protein EP330_22470 [Deltaproteobacteria bacterium]|nr:MAG: hypothetical protein EP330_22470 [Deltaproteobacteria bacterium]
MLHKHSVLHRLTSTLSFDEIRPLQLGATAVVGTVLLLPLALAFVAARGASRLWLWTDADTRAHRATGSWFLPASAGAALLGFAAAVFTPLPGVAPVVTWLGPWVVGGLPLAALAGLTAVDDRSRDRAAVALGWAVLAADVVVDHPALRGVQWLLLFGVAVWPRLRSSTPGSEA